MNYSPPRKSAGSCQFLIPLHHPTRPLATVVEVLFHLAQHWYLVVANNDQEVRIPGTADAESPGGSTNKVHVRDFLHTAMAFVVLLAETLHSFDCTTLKSQEIGVPHGGLWYARDVVDGLEDSHPHLYLRNHGRLSWSNLLGPDVHRVEEPIQVNYLFFSF